MIPAPRQRAKRRIHAQQGVLHRMRRVAGARVHHQPRRLVDHQDVPILMDQRQRNGFGQHVRLRFRHRHPHVDSRARLGNVARLAGQTAHQHLAGLDPALDAGARMLRHETRQGTVEPLPGQFLGDFQLDDLELCAHRGTRSLDPKASGCIGYTRATFFGPHCKELPVRLRVLVHPSRILLAIVGIAMLATGCRSHRADDAKSGPEVIYARAQKAMRNSSYGEAIKQLEALQSRFPFSEPARQAQLDLIYVYYKSRQTDPAIDAADTFIRENPTNPRVDYAYYMKGLVYFERQANFLERYFNVDLSQRPPINARKSFEAFDDLIKKYPHSQYDGDARQRMIFLRNRLADFELHVALYYMRRGAFVGALARAKYCVENYDGAPAVRGSLKVIVDAYRQLGMTDLAANAEKVYADNYPGNTRDIQEKKSWFRRFF